MSTNPLEKRPLDNADLPPHKKQITTEFPVLIQMLGSQEIIGYLVPFGSIPDELAKLLLSGETQDWSGTVSEHGQAAREYMEYSQDGPITASASEALGLLLMQIGETQCPNCYDNGGIDTCRSKKFYHTQCDTVYVRDHQAIRPTYTINVDADVDD